MIGTSCWFHGSSFKGFSIVFPVFRLAKVESSQKSNRTWLFLHFFAPHICSAVTKTIRVTNYATSFGAKNVQKTKFEAAEMILDRWNQQMETTEITSNCSDNITKYIIAQ